MMTFLLRGCGVWLWVHAFAVALAPCLLAAPPGSVQSLIENRCANCHEGPDAEGGLDITSLGSPLDSPANLSHWVRIIDRVAAGEMPPEDAGSLGAAA
jgi:uncharacterized membrane protein